MAWFLTEGGQVNIVDEGRADEGVQGVLREFHGVHVRANHAGDDGNDVHVGDSGTDLGEGSAGLWNEYCVMTELIGQVVDILSYLIFHFLLHVRGDFNEFQNHLNEKCD